MNCSQVLKEDFRHRLLLARSDRCSRPNLLAGNRTFSLGDQKLGSELHYLLRNLCVGIKE